MVSGTVIANVVKQGVRATNTTREGRHCTVSYVVKDLVGGTDQEGYVFDAMEVEGIPSLNDAFPNVDLAYPFLYATSITSEALGSGSQFLVTVAYGLPDPQDLPAIDPDRVVNPESYATVTVETVVVEVETEFDIRGKQIFTEQGKAGDTGSKVTGKIRYFAPSTKLTYMRNETSDPRAKARIFVGGVNDTVLFNSDGKGTWLCTNLSGQTSDGGVSYMVNYGFQRSGKVGSKPDANQDVDTVQPWDPLVVQQDPKTGRSILGPVMDIGMKIVDRYPPVNFGALKLTF